MSRNRPASTDLINLPQRQSSPQNPHRKSSNPTSPLISFNIPINNSEPSSPKPKTDHHSSYPNPKKYFQQQSRIFIFLKTQKNILPKFKQSEPPIFTILNRLYFQTKNNRILRRGFIRIFCGNIRMLRILSGRANIYSRVFVFSPVVLIRILE